MKNEKLFSMLSNADGKYIEESNPLNFTATSAKKHRFIPYIAAACVLCAVLLAVAMPTFIHSLKYRDVYKHLSKFEPPELSENESGNDVGYCVPPPNPPVEITEDQSELYTMGDITAQHGNHIFYLDGNKLYAYEVDKATSVNTAVYEFDTSEKAFIRIFLSDNGKMLTAVVSGNAYGYSELISLDVSDVTSIKQTKRMAVSGSLVTARRIDGEFYIVSYASPWNENGKYGVFKRYNMPEIGEYGNTKPLSRDQIVVPKEDCTEDYYIFSKFDETTLELKNVTAYFMNEDVGCYDSNMYISNDNLFLKEYAAKEEPQANGDTIRTATSIIHHYKFVNGRVEYRNCIELNGYFEDKYAFYEQDGILFAVTETRKQSMNRASIYEPVYRYDGKLIQDSYSNVNLYCIDVESMQLISSVENFASSGESVKSVYFDNDRIYVRTEEYFRMDKYEDRTSAPVFRFDVSDINNIKYEKVCEVPEAPEMLVAFGSEYFLGVVNDEGMHRFVGYRQTENGVEEVAEYKLEYFYYAWSRGNFYLDREKGLFGFSVSEYIEKSEKEVNRYCLFRFDGNEITLLAEHAIDAYKDEAYDNARAFYIDGYLYVIDDAYSYSGESKPPNISAQALTLE